MGSGTARVPDLPQYIISKLGLNKNLLIDQLNNDQEMNDQTENVKMKNDDSKNKIKSIEKLESVEIERNAPKEEDFDSIRVCLKFIIIYYYKLIKF